MKLLLDENLSPRMAKVLTRAGHDAVSVYEVGLSGTTDADVKRFAVDQGRYLVTLDGAGEAVLPEIGDPGMIRLTVHSYREDAIEDLLLTALVKLRHMQRRRKAYVIGPDGKLIRKS